MLLDKKNIKHIEQLAQIAVEDDEIEQYIKDCSDILSFVQQIQNEKTDNIAPLSHPLDATQRLREDKVCETNQRDALASLTELDSHLYAVPKVIE